MAKATINIGTTANDGTGDSLRAGATKINQNLNEIYNSVGDGTNVKTLVNSNLELDIPNDDNKINKVSFHAATLNQMNAISPADYHGAMLHVHEGGTVYVAHSNAWRRLLLDTSGGSVPNYTDPLKAVAYGGNITDLADVDTTSTPPVTGNVLKWDGAKWAPGLDVTQGGAGLDADTLDGQDGSYYINYNNLNNKPTIPTSLIQLGISDGDDGQVLTTDGEGNFSFTTIASGSIQNIFETVDADTGTTTANNATDTLTVAGGTNIATAIVGDTLTINYVGDPNSGEENQFAFSNVQSDSGLAEADSKTDTLTIAGGTNISTSVTGDTLTINYTGTASDFNSLSDVTITNPGTGQLLTYDTDSFVNVSGFTIDQIAYPAITALVVTADSSNGYKFDQYGNTEDPTIFAISGTTIAFKLNSGASHPFRIETSSGTAYDTGLVHVDIDGTVSTGANAQAKTQGTLYWKIPANISGDYAYQCTVHGNMRGTITIKSFSGL